MAFGLRAAAAVGVLWGLYSGTWLNIAPNRLLPGVPTGAPALLGPWVHAVAALAAVAALLGGRPGQARPAPVLAVEP